MARILLIDDEIPLRALVRLWLDARGHEAIESSSGVQALHLIGLHQLDLIITDLFMPDLDGIELTREIRRRGMSVPIIVISGASSEDLAQTMKAVVQELGATTALTKPFSREELFDEIQRALRAGGESPST